MGVDEILHQSAGWRTLETSCKALLEVARSEGQRFAKHVDEEVLGLVTRTLSHTNRFVRETGFQICAELSEIVHAAATSSAAAPAVEADASTESGDVGVATECPTGANRDVFDATMSGLIATGLADNWSQVRVTVLSANPWLLAVFGCLSAERLVSVSELLAALALHSSFSCGIALYPPPPHTYKLADTLSPRL